MSSLSCLNFFYRSTSETLGFEWGMRDRTWHQGMSDFPYGGTTETLGLGWGMRDRTWHQGMLFRFILPLRKHHRDFRVGVAHIV